MKKMLGVAAVILMGAPVVHASVTHDKEVSQLTTKEVKTVPHQITVASGDFSKCKGNMIALLPYCNN